MIDWNSARHLRRVAALLAALLVISLGYVAFRGADTVETTQQKPPVTPPGDTQPSSEPTPAPTAFASPATPTPQPSKPASGADGGDMPLGVKGDFTLVKSEAFSRPTLDTKVWNPKDFWHRDGYDVGTQAWCPLPFRKDIVEFSGGTMKIHAVKRQTEGRPITTCSINTYEKLHMTHGYVEAKVKLPTGADLWPAFWLLGNGNNSTGCPWPCTGEIDIFEFVNNGKDNGKPFVTVHWECPNQHKHCQLSPKGPYPQLDGWGKRWITFGLHRTSDELTVYIDGKRFKSLKRTDKTEDGHQLPQKLFDDPMHIRLNNASSDEWSDDKSKSPEEGTFEVAYVKLWRSQ